MVAKVRLRAECGRIEEADLKEGYVKVGKAVIKARLTNDRIEVKEPKDDGQVLHAATEGSNGGWEYVNTEGEDEGGVWCEGCEDVMIRGE